MAGDKYLECVRIRMVSGKYFNKGVKALDAPDVGHVVRETEDKIVVFGDANARYDIPKDSIRFVSGNVLVDTSISEIEQRYKVDRDAPMPESSKVSAEKPDHIDLASYEKMYPDSLFGKGVRARNEDKVGHIQLETGDTIVVFGDHDVRYDIPKSKIIAVGRNAILDMDYPEIWEYKVNKDVPLPSRKN